MDMKEKIEKRAEDLKKVFNDVERMIDDPWEALAKHVLASELRASIETLKSVVHIDHDPEMNRPRVRYSVQSKLCDYESQLQALEEEK